MFGFYSGQFYRCKITTFFRYKGLFKSRIHRSSHLNGAARKKTQNSKLKSQLKIVPLQAET
jgi:hypothetical protein